MQGGKPACIRALNDLTWLASSPYERDKHEFRALKQRRLANLTDTRVGVSSREMTMCHLWSPSHSSLKLGVAQATPLSLVPMLNLVAETNTGTQGTRQFSLLSRLSEEIASRMKVCLDAIVSRAVVRRVARVGAREGDEAKFIVRGAMWLYGATSVGPVALHPTLLCVSLSLPLLDSLALASLFDARANCPCLSFPPIVGSSAPCPHPLHTSVSHYSSIRNVGRDSRPLLRAYPSTSPVEWTGA